MTGYSLAMPAGQVVGGFLIGAAATAGWSYSARFWLASGCCLLLAIATWFTSKGPEEQFHRVMYATTTTDDETTGTERVDKVPLRQVLGSMFGLFLLISVLTSMANNGINSQISNIMPNVYGISEAETSTLISVAGALNMVLFIPAGRLMAKRGTMPTYSLGLIMRLVGALGMAVVGLISGAPALIAVAFMQLLYQANPFARLAQPGTAVRFATFPAGMANGWLIAGSALGSFAGALLGGVLADAFGFNAVNWMGAAAAAGSIALLVLWLWPAKPVEPERE
jgi:predicted MFS family arabinose efflux permease